MQRAARKIDRLSCTILREELFRSLREHASNFTATAALARDRHVIIRGGLVAQPRDRRRFGALLDRNSLRARHCTAANRSGVRRDPARERLGLRVVCGVEIQILENRPAKIPSIFFLSHRATRTTGVEFFLVRGIFALDRELRSKGVDARTRSPDTA